MSKSNLEKKLSLEDDRFLLKTSLLKVKVFFIENVWLEGIIYLRKI